MNKKVLFTIAPAIIALGAVTGCNGGGGNTPKAKELTKLEVSTALTPATYPVGFEFTKYGLNVTATWSDGSFNTVKADDYSVSPELPYTFKIEDAGKAKDFIVTYLTKSQTVRVNVKSLTNITANWNGSEYISADAGSVSAGTMFNGAITYNAQDTKGFNSISMFAAAQSKHDLKIDDSTATINVTKVINEDGDDITSSCSVTDNVLSTPGGSVYKQNLNIIFTVTKQITGLILVAANEK